MIPDDADNDNADRTAEVVLDYEIGSIYRGTDGRHFEYTIDGFVPYEGEVVNG